jgi:transposase
MIYARQATDEEKKALERMRRQEVGRVSQRAQMVLWSAERRTVPDIAAMLKCGKAKVRHWIKQFNAEGPAGLYDKPRSGRPRRVTEPVQQKIIDWVENDPSHQGYLATFWTVAMLVEALLNTLGIRFSVSAVRAAMHTMGLRWGRPRLAMPRKTDPEKAVKQWRIAKAVVEAGPDTAILYGDEARIELLPCIRAAWHWIGQQIRVPTPGTNKSRAIFGALNIRTGQWAYQVRERMKKEDFIAFLEYLLVAYPTGSIILIVDNYSSHTAHLVKSWLVEHPRLQLYYLPTYCSHLNPIETIWRYLKGEVAANRLYASLDLLLKTVDAFFADMTPEQALTWAAAA